MIDMVGWRDNSTFTTPVCPRVVDLDPVPDPDALEDELAGEP